MFVKVFKSIKSYIDDLIDFSSVRLFKYTILKSFGYTFKIIQDDLTFRVLHKKYAFITSDDTIFIDTQFNKLNEHIKDFILYHEIGHKICGHISKNVLINIKRDIVSLFSVSKEELEADAFAASIVGYDNAIDALSYLKNQYNGIAKIQLNRRCLILKRDTERTSITSKER